MKGQRIGIRETTNLLGCPYLGVHHGAHVLPKIPETLVCVVGVKLPQEGDTAGDKRRPVNRVSHLTTQHTP